MEEFYQTVEEIRAQSDLTKFRDIWKCQKKKIVIFGAGDCGHRIYDMLYNGSIEVECFCDNKLEGLTDETTGLKIISSRDLDSNCSDCMLLICVIDVNAVNSIHNQLLRQGFEESQIFNMREYFFRVPLSFFGDVPGQIQKYYHF